MADEARSMWDAFITAPENEKLLKRYAKSAKEPAPLFETIGEDLGSTNEEVRTGAFWALVAAMPELTNIIHERERRQPGYRSGSGPGPRMVNRGVDIVTHLHRVLVGEHKFEPDEGKGTDPRPFIHTVVNRWKIDEGRKLQRVTSLDNIVSSKDPGEDYSSLLKDATVTFEDEVIEDVSLEESRRELLTWGFLNERELPLFETIYVDDQPLDAVREQLNIPKDSAMRKRISRARKKAVYTRDEILTGILINFPGDIYFKELDISKDLLDRTIKSISLEHWEGKTLITKDRTVVVAMHPLTRGFRGALPRIHLFMVDSDSGIDYSSNELKSAILRLLGHVPATMDQLHSYPTGFPGLDNFLDEVLDSFHIVLTSDALDPGIMKQLRKILKFKPLSPADLAHLEQLTSSYLFETGTGRMTRRG